MNPSEYVQYCQQGFYHSKKIEKESKHTYFIKYDTCIRFYISSLWERERIGSCKRTGNLSISSSFSRFNMRTNDSNSIVFSFVDARKYVYSSLLFCKIL